ncbi:MAG TPA: hypothetical protein VIV60_17750 [Polyangiaceae bacterium]
MTLDLDNLDLLTVTDTLREQFANSVPGDMLEGKTAFRDLLVTSLNCSELEAEELVDTLITRGYLKFEVTELDSSFGLWTIGDGQ